MGCRALILLDTHALVWLDQGNPLLGREARRLADDALADDLLVVCPISFWEIAMLVRRNRLTLGQPVNLWRGSLFDLGVLELPLSGDICMVAGEIDDLHGDPADRLILAAAFCHEAALITADARLLSWPGELRRHDARQ